MSDTLRTQRRRSLQAASTHTHGSAAARPAAQLAADSGQSSPAYYDSGLDPTPYMGWNTYYALGGSPTESSVENVADFLLSSGLASSGYDYVWLDGGWQASTPRNAQGELVANPTEFPDLPDGERRWIASLDALRRC